MTWFQEDAFYSEVVKSHFSNLFKVPRFLLLTHFGAKLADQPTPLLGAMAGPSEGTTGPLKAFVSC